MVNLIFINEEKYTFFSYFYTIARGIIFFHILFSLDHVLIGFKAALICQNKRNNSYMF